MLIPLALLMLVSTASSAVEEALSSAPADSLPARLRRIEATSARPREGAEAALMLGRFHYARGEYRLAAEALSRAAARLDPARKGEALYWAGLSWLALRAPNAARADLEEVASSASPRRAEARLGVALAWELAGRADLAYAALEQLLAEGAGEAGASALERYASLAERFQSPAIAARARARLVAEYPESMEAAAVTASLGAPEPRAPESGPTTVEAGVFTTVARARALGARALRAGFPDARVIGRGEGASRTYAVLLGTYASGAEARRAQARAARQLGVTAHFGSER